LRAQAGFGAGRVRITVRLFGAPAVLKSLRARVASYTPALVAVAERVKPRLRGVAHELGFYVALVAGAALVVTAEPGRARAAALAFSGCLAACLGASALYHRPTWTRGARAWLARLDHAGVYLLIAGTYTPFALLVMSPGWAAPVLSIVWGGTFAATTTKLVWVAAPKWLSVAFGLTLGWSGVAAFSELLVIPTTGLALVLAGAVLYTAGAAVYVRRTPDPLPHVFGYHELFHVLTLAAAACHYAAIAFFVLPRA
jgi:hemolysin III